MDSPDDDLPRLIFADWLEEHGELDRADFIRIQCELGDFYEEEEDESIDANELCGPGRHQELTNLEWSLIHKGIFKLPNISFRLHNNVGDYLCTTIGDNAQDNFDPQDPHNPIVIYFNRGFVSSASLTVAQFLAYGPEISKFNLVEHWNLTDSEPSFDDIERRIREGERVHIIAGNTQVYVWYHNDPRDERQMNGSYLPSRIFDRLQKVSPKPLNKADMKAIYGTRKKALQALSAACDLWVDDQISKLMPPTG